MSLSSFNGIPDSDWQVTNLNVRNNLTTKSITATQFNIIVLDADVVVSDVLDTTTVVTSNMRFTTDPVVGFVLTCVEADGSAAWEQGGMGTGDVVGPASSTAGALAAWDDTTGTLLRNTAITTAAANTVLNFPTGTVLSIDGTDLLKTNASGVFLGRGAGTTTCTDSVAVGDGALAASTGSNCVAIGYQALAATVAGDDNTVVGSNSATNAPGMASCTIVGSSSADACTGSDNVGMGIGILAATTGNENIAIGNGAMAATTTGSGNVAVGHQALGMNIAGSTNVAIGNAAHNMAVETTDSVIIGASARVYSGDNAVVIGSGARAQANSIAIGFNSDANATNSIAIGTIAAVTVPDSVVINASALGQTLYFPGLANATGTTVEYDGGSNGQIGPMASSKRFKEDWKELSYDEGVVEGLQPVTFKYKKSGTGDFGLLAEDVLPVAPRLVTFNEEGQPESVRYHMLGVYLLQEIQHLRTRVAQLESLEGPVVE